tara:strand:- start:2690 stop:2998 length:309 start_codon:yes stop_codon:yes gene_type:complete
MNAIIKQGGHQYNITEGDVIRVDLLSQPEGTKIQLDNVIMAFNGKDSIVDKKTLSSIKIKATIQKHGRYPKVRIVKFKRRKHYMRTQGHRQGFSEIKIESIK